MNFSGMKIATKLLGGFMFVAAVALIIGMTGLFGLGKVTKTYTQISNVQLPGVVSVARMKIGQRGIIIGERGLLNSRLMEKSLRKAQYDYLESSKKLAEDAIKVFEGLPKTTAEAELWNKFMPSWNEWISKDENIIKDSRRKDELYEAGMSTSELDDRIFKEYMSSRDSWLECAAVLDELANVYVKAAQDNSVAAGELAGTIKVVVIVVLIIGVGIALVLGLILAKQITNPLNKVVDMIKDIAEGEGDLTKKVEVSTQDELGDLAKWFNTFIDKLHEIITQIATSTIQTSAVAQETSATSEELASGTEEQQSQTSQVATSMEEMSATIQEVAKNANQAALKSNEAGTTAKKGGEIVLQTIEGIKRIAETARTTDDAIKILTKNSEQIGSIISVIDDVADQTNLLALNAAIEAARAGEQGRGFAVVADEVRKLAERTTSSTREIAGMVKTMQDGTSQAAAAMTAGSKAVTDGVKMAEQAGATLEQIVNASQSVVELVQQVATAAEEQSAAAEEISSNVESVSSVAKQTAVGTQQISSAAQELARLADGLQAMVNKFKLRDGSVKKMESRETKTFQSFQQQSAQQIDRNKIKGSYTMHKAAGKTVVKAEGTQNK